MPPKPKKSKKKAPEIQEPPHDPSWERTVISGLWDRPITALPDANTWPSWGALRERVLSACREIRVTSAPSVRDAFVTEVVKLAPPLLKVLDLSSCHNLHKVSLSPQAACPALEVLNLSSCPGLQTVLVQSSSLVHADLSNCGLLEKVLLQCPRLQTLSITGCSKLEVLMLWSDELAELDLTGAVAMTQLKLQCPALTPEASKLPNIPEPAVAVKPTHPPIASMLRENMVAAATAAAEARQKGWKVDSVSCGIPAVHRSMCV